MKGTKKVSDNWTRMLQQLSAFKKRHGHCRVPANYPDDAQLGRWVAAQRYKRKIDDLSPGEIAQLDEVGFIWVPSEETWTRMCNALVAYKKRHGNVDVPEHWPEDQCLANWVQSQRYRRKKGKLASERVKQLEKMGFSWAIYKCAEEKTADAKPSAPAIAEHEEAAGERIYVIRQGLYTQYSGTGPMSKELERFLADHKGEWPPYIPLPRQPTTFYFGDTLMREKKIKWKGKGVLPVEVMEYVKRNGTLPRYD